MPPGCLLTLYKPKSELRVCKEHAAWGVPVSSARSASRPPRMQADGSSWRGLLVIAALGDKSLRYKATRRVVEQHFEGWSCLGLAWSQTVSGKDARYLWNRCRFVVREGARWGSLLNLTTPTMIDAQGYDYVMVMLDDLVVPSSFNATRFVEEARRHNLSRASPTVWQSTYDGPVSPWQSVGTTYEHNAYAVSACAARGGHCSVRLVKWVETFMTLYTRDAWRCYWTMFDDGVLHNDKGAIGYGYDRCFKYHCGAQHERQGVLLDFVIQHADIIGGSSAYNFSGRRLALSDTANYIVAQLQAYRLQDWLKARHGGSQQCEPRQWLGCGMITGKTPANRTWFKAVRCPILRSDLTVSDAGKKYDSCWHSCCCYDEGRGQPLPRSQWTLSNAALAAKLPRSQWTLSNAALAAKLKRSRPSRHKTGRL